MRIVVALDVHRNQITYKALDQDTGELRRGRIAPATRAEVRAWLGQFVACQVGQAGRRWRTRPGGEALARAELCPAGRELVALGLRMLDLFDLELAPLDRQLRAFARRQRGCRALIEGLYGVGPVSATAILAELGDCRRFSSSDDAVRHAGLDITVYQSDQKRAPGPWGALIRSSCKSPRFA